MDNVANQIERSLFDPHAFRPVGKIDPLVPNVPGFYCLKLVKYDSLPAPFAQIARQRGTGHFYAGLASRSLQTRFLKQELRAKGHGTFFRSVGAVLGFRPPCGSLIGHKNQRNFKFSKPDEAKIIDWMNHSLIANWVVLQDVDLKPIEHALIVKTTPLLNIRGNPEAVSQLSALRKACVDIARKPCP